jgi:hypothetical protein
MRWIEFIVFGGMFFGVLFLLTANDSPKDSIGTHASKFCLFVAAFIGIGAVLYGITMFVGNLFHLK